MNESSAPVPAEAEEPSASPAPTDAEAPRVTPEAPAQLVSDLEREGEQRLDPRFVPFQRAVGWIATAALSACGLMAVGVLWLTAELPRWASLLLFPAWIACTVAIGWVLYAWPAVHYRHVSYTLDTEGIEIRSGVWWRQVMSVPRSRVQHIDVSQGPMERTYGLGRLVLYTAGTSHSRVELAGLSHGVALSLRNYLLPRGSDDAV